MKITTLPIVLRVSKAFVVAMLMVAITLSVVGISLRTIVPLSDLAIALSVFTGLIAVISLHSRVCYLEITEQGFKFARRFRMVFVPWRDVQGFKVVTIEIDEFGSKKLVGWKYSSSNGEAYNYCHDGNVDAILPGVFDIRADELVKLLNEVMKIQKMRCIRSTASDESEG